MEASTIANVAQAIAVIVAVVFGVLVCQREVSTVHVAHKTWRP